MNLVADYTVIKVLCLCCVHVCMPVLQFGVGWICCPHERMITLPWHPSNGLDKKICAETNTIPTPDTDTEPGFEW